MWLSPLLDPDLAVRHIVVEKRHVVYVKGIFEASEGLGAVFAMPRRLRAHDAECVAGALTVAVPAARIAEMERLLADLCEELGDSFRIEPGSNG